MAEVLASLKKIGGNGEKYTETVLWTNPSPTADFAAQTVTLSDSIDNYKYLKIKYCFSTSYNTGNCLSNYIISVDEFKKAPYPEASGTARLNFSFARMNTSNVAAYRRFYYASSTTVRFGSTDTNALIPLEILGVNELAHGEGVLATPFQLELKSTIANGRSVIAFDKSTFPYTKFRVISKVNNLRYISNGSWVTLAVGDIIDFSVLPDTALTIDVSGSNTSTASSIEFYN